MRQNQSIKFYQQILAENFTVKFLTDGIFTSVRLNNKMKAYHNKDLH